MKFDQAIQEYSPEIQEKLGKIFDEWSKQSPKLGLYIVTNIRQREKFLTKEAWIQFLNKILIYGDVFTHDGDTFTPDGDILTHDQKREYFEEKYKTFCRKLCKDIELFSKSSVIDSELYQTLGNAQDLNYFFDSFMKLNRRDLTNKEEEFRDKFTNAVDFYNSGDQEQALVELQDYTDLPVRERNMWATWDLDFDNPFRFMLTNDPDEVRLCLALGEQKKKDKPMLLMTYSWEREVYKPTVVDADLHPYYRPTLESNQDYGMTHAEHTGLNTLARKLEQKGYPNGYNRLSRPEGINEPIIIGNLRGLKILTDCHD